MSHKWCAMWKVTCDSSERICLDVKYIYHYLTQTKDIDSKIKKGRFSVADILFKGSCKMCLWEDQRVSKMVFWLLSSLPVVYIFSTASFIVYLNSQKVCFKPNLFCLVHTAELMGFPRVPFQRQRVLGMRGYSVTTFLSLLK